MNIYLKDPGKNTQLWGKEKGINTEDKMSLLKIFRRVKLINLRFTSYLNLNTNDKIRN